MTNYLETGVETENGKVILIPYNTNNVLITENDVLSILRNHSIKIDKINKMELFNEAFTHESYTNNKYLTEEILNAAKKEMGNPSDLVELRDTTYQRLEFMGDKVIKAVFTHYLTTRYEDQNEGFLSRLQTKLEDKNNLRYLALKLNLGRFILISRKMEETNGRNTDKFLEDCFEAFIGALYQSNGISSAFELLINILETYINYSEKIYFENNYNDMLNIYFNANKFENYKFRQLYPTHRTISKPKYFIMGLYKPIEKGNKYKCEIDMDDNPDLCLNVKYIMKNFVAFGKDKQKKPAIKNGAKMFLIENEQLDELHYKKSDIYYPELQELFDADEEDRERQENELNKSDDSGEETE